MADPIFDPEKCPVPPLAPLPLTPFITNCEIPDAPGPIRECPDISPPQPLLPPSATEIAIILDEDEDTPGVICPPQSGSLCIQPGGQRVEGSLPVHNLYFRKDSSFRVWGIPSACPGKFDMLVDIGGGHTDSVFWQGAGGNAPAWTVNPRIGNSLTVGTMYQPGWLFSVGGGGSVFGLAGGSGGSQFWRTPVAGGSIWSHLIVANVNGSCHQLEWSYPGIHVDVELYGGQKLIVRQGIIINVTSPAAGTTFPGPPSPPETVCQNQVEPPFFPCG